MILVIFNSRVTNTVCGAQEVRTHWLRKSQFSMSLSVLPQQIRTAHARDFVTLSVRGSHFRSSEISNE